MPHSIRDYVGSNWFSGKTKKLIRLLESVVTISTWEKQRKDWQQRDKLSRDARH